ncbi:uncharacterized protein HD556DRAFT_1306422 [Suillus plorans]|uniref:Uncharacterized protein n=1 Tax=Suillus plorans TaxID=116603 RepID=A0A9P7IZ82_9AGAM|nr:uncharacterized protein HD556DRAFT_1306422 [Suillus plorans]KAG1797833.1 hypothetical protein HD556DRAFT_1306422 [Suillus plorans]
MAKKYPSKPKVRGASPWGHGWPRIYLKKTKENIVKQMYKELTCYYGLDDCSAAFDYLQLQSASSQRSDAKKANFCSTRVFCGRVSIVNVSHSSLANFCSTRVFCGRVSIVNASPSSLANLSSTHVFCGRVFIVNASLLLLFYLSSTRILWTFSIMARTKNTAKNCTGGSAPCIHLKILKTAAKSLSREPDGGQSLEMSKPVHHNEFCILCRDGSASFKENTLFMCNHCPRVMCRLCMRLPPGTEDTILNEDVSFRCICCHIAMEQQGAPYYVHASLELSSCAELSVAPVIFIHLILVDFDTMASPFSLAHSFLQPYFTSGGIEYREITFNIVSDASSYRKTVHQIIKDLKNSFAWECVVVGISTHTDNDSGNPFAGYSLDGEKHYAGASTEEFLDGILSPWQSLLDHADETYLWLLCCGAIVNNSDSFVGLQHAVVHHKLSATVAFNAAHFQPSFASHLLLAFTEQVLVEHCPIGLAFGDMLAQAYKLGRHTDVFLLIPLVGSLKVSKFVWADVKFRPWGGFLPIQCPSCGWTDCWRSVFVRACKDKVYVFECKNDTCTQSFSFSPPEGATMLTPDIMASWTLVFSNVLNEYKDSFVAAKGNSVIRARILKTIKDAIGSSEAAKDPCVMLPEKNLAKAVRAYYLDFLEDDEDRKAEEEIIEGGTKDTSAPDAVTVEMVRQREDDKPEDAGKYKTEFSGFDVVQKLFKDEFAEYDKQHRDTSNPKSMGQRTRLARMWHQAMSPEVKKELERVAGKWNQEGPPADTKDRYRTHNQKKMMEDFMDMVRRTMGLHVVILTAYDRGEGKAPGTTVWETSPQKAKKPFTQATKDNRKWAEHAQDRLANWLLEGEYAKSLSADGEDDDENNLSDLTVEVDDDGFGSLKLKHRQQLVQSVFQKAYAVITNNPRALVPWGEMSTNPNHYLDSGCIPENVVIRDPSHLQKDTITVIYSHWKDCASHDMLIVHFVGYRQADFYDARTKKGAAKGKSRKKPAYVEVSSDEEGLLNKVANGKSSSDEDDIEVETPTIPDSSPKYHLARDMVPYLKSLSTVPSYHHLLTVVQKLPQRTDSKSRKQKLPVWAPWTWSQAYLPQDIHENMKTASVALENLSNYQFNSRGWGMVVSLGLGLLLRNSILGIQMGDQIEEKVVGIGAEVEAMLKDENLGLSIVRKDIEKRRSEEKKKLKEKRRVEEKKRAEEEKRVEEEERLAKEASKVDKRVRKSNAKGKDKRFAADVEEPSKKKVKASPPDLPRRSARDKAPPKKYNV